MLTHGDVQNNGGAERLNQFFGVGEIYPGPAHFARRRIRKLSPNLTRRPAVAGSSAGAIPPVAGRSLHPQRPWTILTARTMPRWCCRRGLNGVRVLLLSDLGRKGQASLLSRTNISGGDVMIAGLTDERTALRCVARRRATENHCGGDSEFPPARRASRELKERLGRKNVPVIYTRTSGAVTLGRAVFAGWELRHATGVLTCVLSFPGDSNRIRTIAATRITDAFMCSGCGPLTGEADGNVAGLRKRKISSLPPSRFPDVVPPDSLLAMSMATDSINFQFRLSPSGSTVWKPRC